MKTILALLIIVFIAFSGYHMTFRAYRVTLPLAVRKFYLTGTEFLFLGLLLGPEFFNLFDRQTQASLEPLATLVLGWVGMLCGFQFEIGKLKHYPFQYFISANLKGGILVMCFLPSMYGALAWFPGLKIAQDPSVMLILAATAACCAQTGLAMIPSEVLPKRDRTLQFLYYVSSIGALFVMVLYGLSFFWRSVATVLSWNHGLRQSPVGVLAVGTLLIVLFILLLRRRLPESELILVVMGMILLISGMASIIGFSPILINFVAGLVLVNLSPDKERIYRIIHAVEKPVYILLLIFLGTIWRIDHLSIWIGAVVYCLCRIPGTFMAAFFLARITGKPRQTTWMGVGLLEQGGLAMALALDVSRVLPDAITSQLVSLILVAVVLNDLMSIVWLKKLSRNMKMDIGTGRL